MIVKESKQEAKSYKFDMPATRSVGDLVAQIEGLRGKEKQSFCKTLSSTEKSAYLKYLRDRDMEIVECTFRSHDPAGGSVTLNARPYAGEMYSETFIDGQTYSIPLYLAKRMNSEFQGIGTWYPTHSYILDAQGKPILGVGKKNYRFSANSTSFS
jgi:hypothetical protein